MAISEGDLEQKFLYRLTKATYTGALFFGLVIIGVMGWSSRPTEYIDSKKSYLACANGNRYSLETAKIYLFTDETELNEDDIRDARKLCAYGLANDYSSQYRALKTPDYKNYTVNTITSIRGSWEDVVLLWWVLGAILIYSALNIIKETLLYIFFGKSFSWQWLQNYVVLDSPPTSKYSQSIRANGSGGKGTVGSSIRKRQHGV